MGCAVKQPLEIEQGATFKFKINWFQDDEITPVDLTNYTARMQIRSEVTSTTVLLELTTENGRITLNGASGVIDLYVSATDTAALAFTAGVYDLELVDGSNSDVYRLMYGLIEVSPEVTR